MEAEHAPHARAPRAQGPEGPLALSPERLEACKKLIAKYERPQSALLPLLYIAQEQWGFISPQVEAYVANMLGIPERHVTEVVSFYTMFRRRDMGRYRLEVCHNITCSMLGAKEFLKVIQEEFGLEPGGVTEDKLVSCRTVECLGSCDTAPVCIVNDEYVEGLKPEQFRELLKKLKAGDPAPLLAKCNK